ncbi:MAG TPA: DUF1015 family protein [Polyangiales bacterium]|jgi:uncharacterized protein (DUF1015 family)|nr:DUF1015 family protein [Polyangiales bacterium]
MLRIRPFAALRPRPELASKVAAVPYDVVNTEEARALAADNPLSFLHVSRAEIDFPAGCDPYAPAIYEKARDTLQALQRDGVLQREANPGLYVYLQEATLGSRKVRQVGVVGCCHIDDYATGVIKKHEKTRKDKEDDRTRHTLTLRANSGPVFLMYERSASVAALMDAAMSGSAPLYDFVAPDGVRHAIWRMPQNEAVVKAFANVSCAYVADGHHRSASAARAGAELRTTNPHHSGDEEYNWFLCVLFPADMLTILPYHRVVKDLNGLSVEQLLAAVRKVGCVEPTSQPEPEGTGAFGMFVGGQWYRVRLPKDSIDTRDPVGSLDYVLLSERILTPILGIGDLRTDKRIDFVGGIRGPAELEKRVRSGECAIAFAMHATTIEQLLKVADAGEIMPPKSTWFEPKLRSGLLIHTL